jgi:hypothetical protein
MPKKILLAVLFTALLTTAALVTSRAASLPGVPLGVAPEMWHPISDRLGIAIRDEKDLTGRSELYGTFMVRDGAEWRGVYLAAGPPGVVPAR